MQIIFIIPSDFSAKDYNSIEQIREVRPFKLVYYETILENLCKGVIKLQKEINIDSKDSLESDVVRLLTEKNKYIRYILYIRHII